MSTFFTFLTQHKLPSKQAINRLFSRPLTWQGVVLGALIALALTSGYLWIISVNNRFLTQIPAEGGTLTEGVIGSPKLINPILATTNTDRALTQLVYIGLVKKTNDGFAPDLAQTYTNTASGYTFTLPTNARWSDGAPLTSSDVAFTYQLAASQNPLLQTIQVSTPDAQTVIITSSNPNTDILSNATLGIMPEHIWDNTPAEALSDNPYNLKPVGNGPFRVTHVQTKNDVTTSITLKRNKFYTNTHPHIHTYRFVFFANQQALLAALGRGRIDVTFDATTATVAELANRYELTRIPSPYMIGIFGRGDAVSQATANTIQQAIDNSSILAIVENGYVETSDEGSNPPPSSVLSIAVQNDSELLRAARALNNILAPTGISLTIKAFDPGAFEDGTQRQQYPIVLSSQAPAGYQPIASLYTKSYLLTRDPDISLALPPILGSPTERYRFVTDWYVRHDDVWDIFVKHND